MATSGAAVSKARSMTSLCVVVVVGDERQAPMRIEKRQSGPTACLRLSAARRGLLLTIITAVMIELWLDASHYRLTQQ